jgi:hypothetical protein
MGSNCCPVLYLNNLIADDKWNREGNFQKGWWTQCTSWLHVYEGIFSHLYWNHENFSKVPSPIITLILSLNLLLNLLLHVFQNININYFTLNPLLGRINFTDYVFGCTSHSILRILIHFNRELTVATIWRVCETYGGSTVIVQFSKYMQNQFIPKHI